MDHKTIQNSKNFLVDHKLVKSLVQYAHIHKNDAVYEIGLGKGIITKELARVAGSVISVELDQVLASQGAMRFATQDHVKVVQGNFLKTPLPKSKSYKVFANIPFNFTAAIIKKLTKGSNPATESFLIMQEEAARKYAGQPYNRESLQSLILKPRFEMKIIRRIDRLAFLPVPRVNSSFIVIKRREKPYFTGQAFASYQDFVTYGFCGKGATFKERMLRIFSHQQYHRLASSIGFSKQFHPKDLTFTKWCKLFDFYNTRTSPEKKYVVKGSYQRLAKEQQGLKKIHRNRRRYP